MKRNYALPNIWIKLAGLLLCLVVFSELASIDVERIGGERLRAGIDSLLTHEAVKGAQVSLVISHAATAGNIMEHQVSRRMIPASLQKLFTSVAAIRRFGLNHRFNTRLGYRGEIRDSILHGDLIIVADGDPSWTERIYPEGGHVVFEQWADTLKVNGINRIDGKLVIHTGKFAFQRYGIGWERDDLPYGYAAPISPFTFNENAVGFDLVAPDTLSVLVNITTRFAYSYLTLENRLRTAPAHTMRNIVIRYADDKRRRIIEGTMPMGTDRTVRASVIDPVDYAAHTLKEAFNRKGVFFDGSYQTKSGDPQKVEMIDLFTFRSVDLIEMLRVMLKASSNIMAEMLLHQFGRGAREGTGYMKQMLREIGINPSDLSIADGSGLSRKNLVSAKQVNQLLLWCFEQTWFTDFHGALAITGEEGTLKNRLIDADISGRIHAKTGSLTGVNTLAGYLTAADGELYAFTIMCGGYKSAAAIMDWQDMLCRLLLRYDRTLDVRE